MRRNTHTHTHTQTHKVLVKMNDPIIASFKDNDDAFNAFLYKHIAEQADIPTFVLSNQPGYGV